MAGAGASAEKQSPSNICRLIRPKRVLGVGPQPEIVGDDLNEVADQLIARHKARA